MSLLKTIEDKLAMAADNLKQHNESLTKAVTEIESLSNNRNTLTTLIHQWSGFQAAYQEIKNLIKDGVATASDVASLNIPGVVADSASAVSDVKAAIETASGIIDAVKSQGA